jgi:hypothetical protein
MHSCTKIWFYRNISSIREIYRNACISTIFLFIEISCSLSWFWRLDIPLSRKVLVFLQITQLFIMFRNFSSIIVICRNISSVVLIYGNSSTIIVVYRAILTTRLPKIFREFSGYGPLSRILIIQNSWLCYVVVLREMGIRCNSAIHLTDIACGKVNLRNTL